MSFRVSLASVMRKIASYLTKNRSETDRKIAQSTHENEYIKPEKTFCRNSKQFLRKIHAKHTKGGRIPGVIGKCALQASGQRLE